MPEADVVIHSGDFCMVGNEAEAIDFLNWFCDLSYRQKIFICGNHDECLYGADVDGLDENVHYLCNSGIEIDGIRFYGVPMFMGDCITDRQSHNYDRIPDETDVLITHSPAYGILDYDDEINYGSREILSKIETLHPKAHLFGHIHRQHGILCQGEVVFSNGAIMNEDYSKLNTPNLIEI
ncbi:MAG: metallophosphoesterase [Bacteroidales bacterium]|nr:metallophosphoesterase [Bacteroidales bacterium]